MTVCPFGYACGLDEMVPASGLPPPTKGHLELRVNGAVRQWSLSPIGSSSGSRLRGRRGRQSGAEP
jgi:hypothetical protein